jgi:lipopolysaccharide/colanic/teichoic acid biosynthesis glycosyltransferase
MREEWGENLGESLRATRLDKLPLLYNVVRGDMSLVGPEQVEAEAGSGHTTNDPEVLSARPGVTGIRHHIPRSLRSQVAKIALDRFYVLHWSMWLDLRIVWGALTRVHTRDATKPAK